MSAVVAVAVQETSAQTPVPFVAVSYFVVGSARISVVREG